MPRSKSQSNLSSAARRGGNVSASSQALIDANARLTDTFEQEHAWRLDLMKSNEMLSRKAVETEMETKTLTAQSRDLSKRLKDLTEARDAADRSVNEVAKQVAALEKQRDGAMTKQSALQGEANSLEREIRELQREMEGLQKKTESLQVESGRLGKDVSRLEELRTQYLNEIAKFKEAKRRLTNM
jgi:chromosome segregation ATPase